MASSVGVKVLPSVPAHKADKADLKVTTLKTKRNLDIDASKIKTYERGVTEWHTVEANVSVCVKIITKEEKKSGAIYITPVCKDTYGSLSYYVVSESDGEFVVLVENLLSEPREFKLNYMIYFD